MVGNRRLTKSTPGDQPECQPIAFVALPERIDHRTSNQAETAGTAGRIAGYRKPAHHPVEPIHCPRSGRAIVASGARAPDDVEAVAPASHEVADQRRWILEVGGHHDGRVAAAVVDARGNRDMTAEIARKTQGVDAIVAFTQCRQHFERTIATAIVDEHELPRIIAERLHHFGDPVVKSAQVAVLVEDRHHDGQQRLVHDQFITSAATVSMTRS